MDVPSIPVILGYLFLLLGITMILNIWRLSQPDSSQSVDTGLELLIGLGLLSLVSMSILIVLLL